MHLKSVQFFSKSFNFLIFIVNTIFRGYIEGRRGRRFFLLKWNLIGAFLNGIKKNHENWLSRLKVNIFFQFCGESGGEYVFFYKNGNKLELS